MLLRHGRVIPSPDSQRNDFEAVVITVRSAIPGSAKLICIHLRTGSAA